MGAWEQKAHCWDEKLVFSLRYRSSLSSFLTLSFCLTKGNYEDGIYKFFFKNKFLSLHEIPPNNSTGVFWKCYTVARRRGKSGCQTRVPIPIPHFYFCDASPVTSALWASVSSFVKMQVVTIMRGNYCKDTITYVQYRWYILSH